MPELAVQIEEAAEVIRRRWSGAPEVGLILGTGMRTLAGELNAEETIPFADIRPLPAVTAPGHDGLVICGSFAGVSVVAFSGRLHTYEGYPQRQATLPVRVIKELGAEVLVLTNAAGGLNPMYAAGDVVVLDDHINLMNDNPLIAVNDPRLGPQFPDMSQPYDSRLSQRALSVARRGGFAAHRGVYIGMSGPNLETRAEYRLLRRIGGDVVGMSTVPEVIVAVHCGLRVLGLSVVSNVCLSDALKPMTSEEILRTAATAEPKLRAMIAGALREEFVEGEC